MLNVKLNLRKCITRTWVVTLALLPEQHSPRMKGNGKGGEQDKGKGKGFWEGAKGTWGSGKNNSKGHKG